MKKHARTEPSYVAVKCNVCGADNYDIYIRTKPLERHDTKRKFTTTSNYVGNNTIVKCCHCGLIYVNPQTNNKEIIEGYSSNDESIYVEQSKWRSETFKRSLVEIEQYKKPPGKLLDVGCAAGLFLDIAKHNGWQVEGVEPNKWLAHWGKKHLDVVIRSKPFEEVSFKKNSFDVITFWDVLEHFADPKKSLIKSAGILKKNGYLVVNYPDIGSWPARLFGKKWWFILSIHLYYFSSETIKRILKESGFRLISIKPHIQRLSLGYLVYRLKPYNASLYKLLMPVVKALKMEDLEIPYYAGQTMVVAQKL